MMSSAGDLLRSVQALQAAAPNRRTREILQSLVRHLHQLASEVNLTRDEWLAGLKFLNRVGQTSTAERDESMLLSDVLGLSTLIDVLHQSRGATEGTVLGPYYVPDSPARASGASVIDSDDGGQRLIIQGVVRATDGRPLVDAAVDVWSCASNGLYPAQDSTQAATNLRGVFKTDTSGRFELVTLRPTNYSVPTDGPVGDLLRLAGRSPMRAAHIHFIVSAPGYETVVTHLFDSASTHLEDDAVFSVRPSLVREFQRINERNCRVQFDVTLAPMSESSGLPDAECLARSETHHFVTSTAVQSEPR